MNQGSLNIQAAFGTSVPMKQNDLAGEEDVGTAPGAFRYACIYNESVTQSNHRVSEPQMELLGRSLSNRSFSHPIQI
jgi:hypothetical protein